MNDVLNDVMQDNAHLIDSLQRMGVCLDNSFTKSMDFGLIDQNSIKGYLQAALKDDFAISIKHSLLARIRGIGILVSEQK